MSLSRLSSRALFLLLGSALTLEMIACKDKCPEPKDFYFNLDADPLSRVPYSGFETISFLKNKSDTYVFVGNGKKFYYNVIKGPMGGCPSDNEHYQGFLIEYTSKNNVSIFFRLERIASGLIGTPLLEISLKNKSFVEATDNLYPPFDRSTMSILNHNYDSVYFMYENPAIDTLYYNVKEGMLKFGFSNGEIWELIPK